MKDNQQRLEEVNRALEEQLLTLPSQLQMRCLALEKQLSSMPTSLTVAGAQLRVMEAKMQEHEERYRKLQNEEQLKSAHIHKELEAFMRKHTSEKQNLLKRISEQAETIHQLTHHMHLLQSKYEEDTRKLKEDLPTLTSNKFGGSFPVFFKENSEHHPRSTVEPSTSHSYVTAPWPVSDPLDRHRERVNQSKVPAEKSFVSRMTEGISHHSSSFIAPDPSTSRLSTRRPEDETCQSLPNLSTYFTPEQNLHRGTTHTEKTIKVFHS